MTIEIPSALFESVKNGKVVLFLGAGASIGAISSDGTECPKGYELGHILSDTFLNGEQKDKPLSTIAEYAIATSDLLTVQHFVHDFFNDFYPADFHKKIASFKWAGLFTTNYDLVIERAYSDANDKLQELVPVVKNLDRVDQKIRENMLPYNKLHGCISHWNVEEIPLIFTVDQYVDHKENRTSLFNRLLDYGREYTVVFVGYSLEDHDIREALLELNKHIDVRPRYYTVTPSVNKFDKAVLEKKRVEPIESTFEEFLLALDCGIDKTLRSVVLPERKHEIERKFVSNEEHLSDEGAAVIGSDITYIFEGMQIEKCDPQDFYRGASYGWGAIERGLDCRRLITDSILSDVILVDEPDRLSKVDFYLLSGHAGSGKTCTLKRIAWDAAIEFEKVCFFIDSTNRINLKPIIEVSEKCNERVFVFVDKCSLHIGEIIYLYQSAKRQQVPITILASERHNEWNVDCVPLHSLIADQWLLPYLKEKEIGSLLDKLTENKCLGVLKNLSREEQESAFRSKAQRQLLVALYEVTVSKPFEMIVFDEYKNIEPEKARLIYRTICALNKWGVPVRSGLIHRIFDINFEEFKNKFFIPLEHIVQTNKTNAEDYSYQARHPQIAEFVFEQAFDTVQERFDLILTIISCMDLGYGSDYRAFREIIKARNLAALFKDPVMVRKIYDVCKEMANNDDFYHQQIAHFEFKRDNPNYSLAEKHLDIAEKLNPNNSSIVHSRSLLQLQRSKNAKGLERERLLSSADSYAKKSISANSSSDHGYQTVCDVGLERLKDLMSSDSEDDLLINETIKSLESTLSAGQQKYPNSEFLLSTESRFRELIGDSGKAIAALERAFKSNDSSPFVASALAKSYKRKGQIDKAREVLETLLHTQAADKNCNGLLGALISRHYPEEAEKALLHMRRSFTKGDTNYRNQFWYARQLYIEKQYVEANSVFLELKSSSVDFNSKNIVKGIIRDKGVAVRFKGSVCRIETTYAFIKNTCHSLSHFLHKDDVMDNDWDKLSVGSEITYCLGFNFKGPSCVDVMLANA